MSLARVSGKRSASSGGSDLLVASPSLSGSTMRKISVTLDAVQF